MPLYISELTISSCEISKMKVQKRTQTYTHKHILNQMHTHTSTVTILYAQNTNMKGKENPRTL